MIERYTLPEMGELWSEETKFGVWLEVELMAAQSQAEPESDPPVAVENAPPRHLSGQRQ